MELEGTLRKGEWSGKDAKYTERSLEKDFSGGTTVLGKSP